MPEASNAQATVIDPPTRVRDQVQPEDFAAFKTFMGQVIKSDEIRLALE